MTAVSGDGEDGSGELLLGSLEKYTRYTIVVQAFNQVGHGPLSEPVSAQTLEDCEIFYFFSKWNYLVNYCYELGI